jgi:hypothetical protein
LDVGEAVGGTPEEAQTMVATWFDRMIQSDDDLGWSLVYPTLREPLFGSELTYRTIVSSADWTGFEYQLRGMTTKDGDYRVSVAFPASSPPDFLTRLGFLGRTESVDGVLHGTIIVQIPLSGIPRGIQAVGCDQPNCLAELD